MAKIMMEARPGALSEVLKAKGKTQVDIASAMKIARKTVRRINEGLPVKDGTLKSVADYLRVPVEHLLPGDAPVPNPDASQGEGNACEPDDGSGLLLRKLDANGIYDTIECTPQIKWTLTANPLPAELIPELRSLERAVYRLDDMVNLKGDWKEDVGTLERELKKVEATEEIERIVSLLVKHKISILGGSHLHWDYNLEQYRTYEDSVYRHEYTSKVIAEFWIVSGNVQSKRVRILAGFVPPKASPADGPEVYVNGKPLPVSEPQINFDDQIPF